MEFNEKLQGLRKQKGLTQEELAQVLFVSRTAVSKWESGRGYPNIDSLKAISKFFGITIDELLSGDELLTIAEEDGREKQMQLQDLVFGLLDCSVSLLFFLPLFGQKADGAVHAVSLLSLTAVSSWIRAAYCVAVLFIMAGGMLTLALQNRKNGWGGQNKRRISLLLNMSGVFLFTLGRQPYAAAFLLVFMAIKMIMLMKKR